MDSLAALLAGAMDDDEMLEKIFLKKFDIHILPMPHLISVTMVLTLRGSYTVDQNV